MDKNNWGWKGGQHWQGVHLQLAYSGMLIRPATTRHLPLKCHILVRRAGKSSGFRRLLSGKWCRGLFAFPVAISFLFSLPRAFSRSILLLFLLPLLLCCLLCDEWLHFKLSSFLFFFSSFLSAGIDYKLCNCAETRLISLKNTGVGAAEEGKYRLQLHFTLMYKFSYPRLWWLLFRPSWLLQEQVLIRGQRPEEECKQMLLWLVIRHDTVRILWPFKWQNLLSACFHSLRGAEIQIMVHQWWRVGWQTCWSLIWEAAQPMS